jgi:predicted DNA-binding transcriptional regulator AlpA
MAKSTLLHDATPDELIEKFNQNLKVQLDAFKKELTNSDSADELMTQKEVCELLQIDPSTLWHWCNQGRLKKYGIAKRRYYKRSEIMEALILLKKG